MKAKIINTAIAKNIPPTRLSPLLGAVGKGSTIVDAGINNAPNNEKSPTINKTKTEIVKIFEDVFKAKMNAKNDKTKHHKPI